MFSNAKVVRYINVHAIIIFKQGLIFLSLCIDMLQQAQRMKANGVETCITAWAHITAHMTSHSQDSLLLEREMEKDPLSILMVCVCTVIVCVFVSCECLCLCGHICVWGMSVSCAENCETTLSFQSYFHCVMS